MTLVEFLYGKLSITDRILGRVITFTLALLVCEIAIVDVLIVLIKLESIL